MFFVFVVYLLSRRRLRIRYLFGGREEREDEKKTEKENISPTRFGSLPAVERSLILVSREYTQHSGSFEGSFSFSYNNLYLAEHISPFSRLIFAYFSFKLHRIRFIFLYNITEFSACPPRKHASHDKIIHLII